MGLISVSSSNVTMDDDDDLSLVKTSLLEAEQEVTGKRNAIVNNIDILNEYHQCV